jgi:hypothetical protein
VWIVTDEGEKNPASTVTVTVAPRPLIAQRTVAIIVVTVALVPREELFMFSLLRFCRC